MKLRTCLLALALSLGAAVGRADVIELTTGRSVTGTIVEETADKVVVRTPDGRLTLPRTLVKSITRQSKGETALSMARAAAAAGSHEDAERLYAQAAADPDPAVARRAQEELQAYRDRRESAKKHVPAPSTPMPLPEGTTGVPKEGQTLQDDLDRARRALETGEAARARRLLEPLVQRNPTDRALQYLLGRACELDRADDPAREAYHAVLGPTWRRDTRPIAWLGELARRAVAGEQLGPTSVGVGPGWSRVETERFAIYHRFERVEPWFAEEPEAALRDVCERLNVQPRDLRQQGRVQVVIYATKADYEASEGMTLAGGHADRTLAPDGWLKTIRAYPDRTFYRRTYRHEVAHLVVNDLHADLPAWAHEGVATYTEPLRHRAFLRQHVVGRKAAGTLPELKAFMRGEVSRGETVEDVRAFYGQASVLFETLVVLSGDNPKKALAVCKRIRREGPERALVSEGLSMTELEFTFDKIASDRSAPAGEE